MESANVVPVRQYRPTYGGGCAFLIIFILALSLSSYLLIWWWLLLWLCLIPIGFYEYRTYYLVVTDNSTSSVLDIKEGATVQLIL